MRFETVGEAESWLDEHEFEHVHTGPFESVYEHPDGRTATLEEAAYFDENKCEVCSLGFCHVSVDE